MEEAEGGGNNFTGTGAIGSAPPAGGTLTLTMTDATNYRINGGWRLGTESGGPRESGGNNNVANFTTDNMYVGIVVSDQNVGTYTTAVISAVRIRFPGATEFTNIPLNTQITEVQPFVTP